MLPAPSTTAECPAGCVHLPSSTQRCRALLRRLQRRRGQEVARGRLSRLHGGNYQIYTPRR